MRRVFKGLISLALIFSFVGMMAADATDMTKCCGGGGCGSWCGSSCGGCCDSGCGGCCGPCGSSCGCGPCGSSCGCGPCGSSCGCGPCGSGCGDCCDTCCQASACGYPFFAYRSTSVNLARQNAGIQPWINRYDMDSTSGSFSVALEYTRSFRPYKMAQFLFGCDLMGCNTLAIQGSDYRGTDRIGCAWLADYFGLSPRFDSRVSFCPRIENVIVDFDLFLGLDEAAEGLYFRLYSPLTWSRWSLNMCECVVNEGIYNGAPVGFQPTYMAGEPQDAATSYHGAIAKNKLPQSFTQAISGCATWGDMKNPLCFGKMTCCKMSCTRLADIHALFGWNFVLDEDYHFGLNLHAVFPTGNRPCAQYLFEPQIGDRKHWQLGGGLSGSWVLWRNEENDDNYLGLYLDANFLHLFKTCQCRSFDFCCKPNSRYMLLAEMGTPDAAHPIGGNDALGGAITNANYTYQKSLIPAINYTTYNINVRIDIQADIALKFGYVRDNWSCDLGYNLWARTGEKFCMGNNCGCCGCPSDKRYAVKGDSLLYGSEFNVNTGLFTNTWPISSSQSSATIRSGENMKLTVDADRLRNKGVDSPKLAWVDAVAQALYSEPLANTSGLQPVAGENIYTSIQPKLLSCDDVNFCKSPSALSHKIFAHFNYAWKDREENWTPYLGVGGEAEFDAGCNQCRFAVSQWGIWLKGGVAFE